MSRSRRRKKNTKIKNAVGFSLMLFVLGIGVLFCNSLLRLLEAFRDLGLSLAYYFSEIFLGDNSIKVTVNDVPSLTFTEPYFEPLRIFPWTWEEFKELWPQYWDKFFSTDNFVSFLIDVANFIRISCQFLTLFLPVLLLFVLLFNSTLSVENTDYKKVSGAVRKLESFKRKIVKPLISKVRDFWKFFRKTFYFKVLIVAALLYFNAVTLIVSFLAFYFYFISSFDFTSIYSQFVKLLYDLAPIVRFLPGIVWFVLWYLFLTYISKRIAISRLQHYENKNRGFINERGVVTVVYGNMGVGKTAMLTSMALSENVQLRDDAFEILLDTDFKFPKFNWGLFREDLKQQMEHHLIYDIPSAKNFIINVRNELDYFSSDSMKKWSLRKFSEGKLPARYVLYGYNLKENSGTYNDGLKIVDIWKALEDYACAYLIYTVQTSLIISNYSIRTDSIKDEITNFPVWDSDFFNRRPELMDTYSRYSHIIDFDMLRLGKRMLKDNPNSSAFGFGVYVISEIDKERKNSLELKETKSGIDECNQKNDLFNSCLKMSRHACVINNKVFLKIFCDLQRPDDWGAGGREVGEVVFIREISSVVPAFPFFSPFWLLEGVSLFLIDKLESYYIRYISSRGDTGLLVYVLKSLTAFLKRYVERNNNIYGAAVMQLDVESGRMDGEVKEYKYYRIVKKDFSRRYSTNCLSAIFDNNNTVGINDLKEYSSIMATQEELEAQNSHFQNDIKKSKEYSS